MISIDNVSYTYRKGKQALSDFSAQLSPGISLVIGPNGAGKTTLFGVMAGMLVPQSGSATFDGVSLSSEAPSLRQRVFYLPDDVRMPFANINEIARVHGELFYPRFSFEKLAQNLAAFGMNGNEPLTGMSTGTRKKANAAYALSLGVDVLLLDEPANGLDIASQKMLNKLIARNIHDDQYILIATHSIYEMRNMFDSVLVIGEGRALLSRTTDEILRDWAFVVTEVPPFEALYTEMALDGYHSIVPNRDGIDTPIDFTLLYSMLCSPSAKSM